MLSRPQLQGLGQALAALAAEQQLEATKGALHFLPLQEHIHLLPRLIDLVRRENQLISQDLHFAVACTRLVEYAFEYPMSDAPIELNHVTACLYEVLVPIIYRGVHEQCNDVTVEGFDKFFCSAAAVLVRIVGLASNQPANLKVIGSDLVYLLRSARFFENGREAEQMVEDARLRSMMPCPLGVVTVLLPALASELGPLSEDDTHANHAAAKDVLGFLCSALAGPAIQALASADAPARTALARVIIPTLVEVATAVGQHEGVTRVLLDQCASVLEDPEGRGFALSLLIDYGRLLPPREDIWHIIRELLTHPTDPVLRKKARAVLEQSLGPRMCEAAPWGPFLALLGYADESALHLFEEHWEEQLEQLHARAGSKGTRTHSSEAGSAKQGTPPSVPAWSTAWELALWRRALTCPSPSITKLVLSSFLNRDWSSAEHLAYLEPSFLVHTLAPAACSPLAHKVSSAAPADFVSWDTPLGDEFAGILREVAAAQRPEANLELLKLLHEYISGREIGRLGAPMLLGWVVTICRVLGSQRLQETLDDTARGRRNSHGVGPHPSGSPLDALPSIVVPLVRLLMARVQAQPGPKYRVRGFQLALQALQASCRPGSPGLELKGIVSVLESIPDDLLLVNDTLRNAVESWLFTGGEEPITWLIQAIDTHFSTFLGIKEGGGMPLLGVKSMTSLAAAYLPSAGTSDPSAEAAKLLSPSEYAAFRSESRHAARLLMAIALGCGSDTALLKNLQGLCRKLLEGLPTIYSRPYLPRGYPEKVLCFATELANALPENDRSALGVSIVELCCTASDEVASFADHAVSSVRDAAHTATSVPSSYNPLRRPSVVVAPPPDSAVTEGASASSVTSSVNGSAHGSAHGAPSGAEARIQSFCGKAEVAVDALGAVLRLMLNRLVSSQDSSLVLKIGAKMTPVQKALQAILKRLCEFAPQASLTHVQRLCFLRLLNSAASGMRSVSGVDHALWLELLRAIQHFSESAVVSSASTKEERERLSALAEAKWIAVETILTCATANGKKTLSLPVDLHSTLLVEALEALELCAESETLCLARVVRFLYLPALLPDHRELADVITRALGIETTSELVMRVTKVLVSSLLSIEKKALGPVTVITSTVLDAHALIALYPPGSELEAADPASSPPLWALRQLLKAGQRSPRIARVAALQLTAVLLQHPHCTEIFAQELVDLAFYEPYTANLPGDPEVALEGLLPTAEPLGPAGGQQELNVSYASHEMAPRVAVLVFFSMLGDAAESTANPLLASCSRAAGQLLARRLLLIMRSKDMVQGNYRSGSQVHRRKVRGWQALSALVRFIPDPADILGLVDIGALEARDVPTIKSYQEVLAASVIDREPSLLDSYLLPRLRDYALKPDAALLYVTVAVYVAMNVQLPDAKVIEILSLVAVRAQEHHQPLRCFTQVAWNLLMRRFSFLTTLSSNTAPRSFGDAFAAETTRLYAENPDLVRFFHKIETRMLETPLRELVSPRGILCGDHTRLKGFSTTDERTGAAVFEGVPLPALEAVQAFLANERSCIRRGLADLHAAKKAGLASSDEIAASNSEARAISRETYQQKIVPAAVVGPASGVVEGSNWPLVRAMSSLEGVQALSALNTGDEGQALRHQLIESSKGARRQDLIVVASLINKIPNLAGLARTCEIFRAAALVVEDVAVTRTDVWKAIAVSSTDWLRILECPENALAAFLSAKKSAGYAILGLEQTNESSSLPKFCFPAKTVLVLGREREGIPSTILNLCDQCIEIPQLGLVRSLNVHVAGALVAYEYTKQHGLGLAGSQPAPAPAGGSAGAVPRS